MTATAIINSIKKDPFLENLIMNNFPSKDGKTYSTMKFLFEEELSLRHIKDFTISKAGKPYLKKSTKRVDLAVFCQISDRKYAGFYPLIGFEIKVSKSDLEGDHKFYKYLPYFDFFFFAVPFHLKSAALSRFQFMDEVGVITISSSNQITLEKAPKKGKKQSDRDMKHILTSFLQRQLPAKEKTKSSNLPF